MKVAIAIWGSRGDAQPVLALALKLRALGCLVKILANNQDTLELPALLQSFGMDAEFYPFMFKKDGDPEGRAVYRVVERFQPSLLLFPPKLAAVAWVVEKRLGVCTIEFNVFMRGSQEGAVGLLFDGLSRMQQFVNASMDDPSVVLDPSKVKRRAGHDRPVLYAVSKEFARTDWPSPTETTGVHLTGYWVLSAPVQGGHYFGSEHDAELGRFLQRFETEGIVYLGWGSMTRMSMAELAARTLHLLGRPGIVLGSYRNLNAEMLDRPLQNDAGRVLWVKWAPHERLMPHCAVIVHHGGAGTTAAAMRAGRPSVVTPVDYDQFAWAREVEARSVGVGLGEASTVTPEILADAVRRCLSSEPIKKAAARLGERLQREEDGAQRTAEWLVSYIRKYVRTGHWKHGRV